MRDFEATDEVEEIAVTKQRYVIAHGALIGAIVGLFTHLVILANDGQFHAMIYSTSAASLYFVCGCIMALGDWRKQIRRQREADSDLSGLKTQ